MILTLVEKKMFGDEIAKLKFTCAELAGKDLHGHVAILTKDGKNKRAYSISLKPSDTEMVFFIKKAGLVSGHMHSLEVGDEIRCDLIYTHHFAKNLIDDKICCIGGGVGIAPLANLMAYNGNPESILIASFRYENEVFIYDEDIPFNTRNTDVYITREYSKNYANGRIPKIGLPPGFKKYYLCGTKEFCAATEKDLVSMGINPYNIISEAW